jgi:amino acid transporter
MGYTFVGILVSCVPFISYRNLFISSRSRCPSKLSGVCMSIAELAALVPLSGAVIRHAEYFFDPALSFAQGWNQIYAYIVSLPSGK